VICKIDAISLTCHVCRRRAARPDVIRNCCAIPGIGDRLASALSAIGITKDFAQSAAAAAGFQDCGCDGRQQALNEFGYALGIGTPPPPPTGPTP